MGADLKSVYTTVLNNEKFSWKEVTSHLFQMIHEILAFRARIYDPKSYKLWCTIKKYSASPARPTGSLWSSLL